MKQNRKYDWSTLLKAFEQASLTQAQFCEQNNINPTYFSLTAFLLVQTNDCILKFCLIHMEDNQIHEEFEKL